MKTKIVLVVALLLWSVRMPAQRMQASRGTSAPEEIWALTELRGQPIQTFVAIGNTLVNNRSTIWISSYNTSCVTLTSAIVNLTPACIARDISVAPPHPVYGPTFYITGWQNAGGIHQLFVARVDLAGNLVWMNATVFPPAPIPMEGVAIVTEPGTNDAVAVGIAVPPLGTPQVTLARFNPLGALVWQNIYTADGEWMPREIDVAPISDGTPGNFIITGEKRHSPGAPVTFAARYNGAGVELWRNLYPATPGFPTEGDAGYDVVFEPNTGNFCIVGVVQTTPVRGTPGSTPYILTVNPLGMLMASSVYTGANQAPLGMYPRCVSLGRNAGEVVFAGPRFTTNRTFFGKLNTILPPGIGVFKDYTGFATANTLPQPFVLNDAIPEDIILSDSVVPNRNYLISTNALPGFFGAGDGHLIKPDLAGNTPDACPADSIPHEVMFSMNRIPVTVEPQQYTSWAPLVGTKEPYPVQQTDCSDIGPVQLLRFAAIPENGQARLNWELADVSNVLYFTIEKSSNGERFSAIGSIPVLPASLQSRFGFTDRDLQALQFYRLKITEKGGAVTYSSIIRLNMVEPGMPFVHPNPAKDYVQIGGQIHIRSVEIYETGGRLVRRLPGNNTGRYAIPGLPGGLFILRAIAEEGVYTFRLTVQ